MFVFALLCLVVTIDATIDTSNLDLRNFRYFKYPIPAQSAVPRPMAGGYRNQQPAMRLVKPQAPPPEAGPFVKARVVLEYVSTVLFGNLPGQAEIPVYFHPEAAYRSRAKFQRQHGYRGDRLVAGLGRGQAPRNL